MGQQRDIAELTQPVVPLEHADGHAFASIAVGEGLGKAYYRAPYEGGVAFLLITDERLQLHVEEPLPRIMAVFPQAISAMELPDHREALRAYLQHYDFEAEDEGATLVVREHGREVLRAEFDEHGRLRDLKGTFGNREQRETP